MDENTYAVKIEKRSADMLSNEEAVGNSFAYDSGASEVVSWQGDHLVYSTTFVSDRELPNGLTRYSVSNKEVFEACDGADEAILRFDGDRLAEVSVGGYRVQLERRVSTAAFLAIIGGIALVLALITFFLLISK